MRRQILSTVTLVHRIAERVESFGPRGILALAIGVAVGSLGIAEAAVRAEARNGDAVPALAQLTSAPAPREAVQLAPQGPVWDGLDIDGDGAPDFANPTGGEPRGHDAFGDGYFHASRDGGARAHEGVDYDSRSGQLVLAPISGYVSKIGYAYPGDERFKYVEIDNPALHLQARVFYVNPKVEVGQTVELGHAVGTAHSLQGRYAGITDHIHLELERRGRRIDAQTVIMARAPTPGLGLAAAMN
ncbi:M23 family metallopeptidase [Phenylobacterium soli]|uniref:M23 family peptidase n=1 Tax=Phenylobacterium soli TaxID=2170551 RepID=A0A328AH55_9CAUL|nr:M23 family metallopeptidase [Phenylobacterium soli]RAK53835.1 M23 family peptidase [Phenylobacterium soli]